jgi:hypothetical protein
LALGLSLGIQATLTALLVLGPSGSDTFAEQLTEHGRSMARPEHDLPIFVAFVVLTLACGVVGVWYWRSKLASLKAAEVSPTMMASALLQAIMAITSLLVSLLLATSSWFSRDFRTVGFAPRSVADPGEAISMLIPGAVALLWAILDLEFGWLGSPASANRLELWHQRINKVLTYVVPVLVILVVGVPAGKWSSLAAQFFQIDGFHHLNFFVMGPAISFAHGMAFGTEIYSQYGIGWPLLAAVLPRFSLLSYGNLLGIEIVYGCLYYVALFFLLRNCLTDEVWATFGVFLAIYWQVFSGMNSNEMIWLFPSSTPMRHPMDIWFFIALVGHQRSGRLLWAALAGFAAALGILFETETGFYLVMSFFVCMILRLGLAPREGGETGAKGWLVALLVFCSATAAALLPLLLYASRGTLFTRAFWRGWTEAFVAYAGQGLGALPIAELPDIPLIFFICILTLYLAVIGYSVVRAWHRIASGNAVLLSTVAAYGLVSLLLFVNRSHPYNLSHAAVPFAVILTALLCQGYEMLPGKPRSTFAWALVGGLALLLLTKPEFERYPSCLASLFGTLLTGPAANSSPTGSSGSSPYTEDFIQASAKLGAAIRAVAPNAESVAILDSSDTVLYQATDIKPWSRYASLFHMLLTKPALEDVRQKLIDEAPACVVIRAHDSLRPAAWEFAWGPLYEVVTNRYVMRQSVSLFEVWQRATQSGASDRAAHAKQPSTNRATE